MCGIGTIVYGWVWCASFPRVLWHGLMTGRSLPWHMIDGSLYTVLYCLASVVMSCSALAEGVTSANVTSWHASMTGACGATTTQL